MPKLIELIEDKGLRECLAQDLDRAACHCENLNDTIISIRDSQPPSTKRIYRKFGKTLEKFLVELGELEDALEREHVVEKPRKYRN